MLRCIYIVLMFAVAKKSCSKGVSEETQKVLLQLVADGKTGDRSNDELIETKIGPRPKTGIKFQCPVSTEERTPTSVHALRPEDIDVVAAIGDSYTAAFGAGANYLGPNAFLEHRGLSFSVGGDGTLETHVSIPNIIKKYNPNVYGFSEGIGQENTNMNVAVSGATSEDLLDMIDHLLERFVDDPLVNMEEDWKLITLFIGGNDIIDSCLKPRFTPDKFKEILMEAFSTLKAMVPRALINVMPLPDLLEIKKLTGVVCDTVHLSMCPCLYAGETELNKLSELTKSYNVILEEMVSSGDYDTEDFAVVFQPYIASSYVPVKEDGAADHSLFAPDCLHLSRRGHASGAYYLWVNMLEPVNSKETKWAPTMDEYLPCPKSPYIYTNRNSVTSNVAGAPPGGVSTNNQQGPSTSDSKSLGGGVITAIVFLVASLIFIAGSVVYRQIHKSRWSYDSL